LGLLLEKGLWVLLVGFLVALVVERRLRLTRQLPSELICC
jgi:hypothetical protein